MARFLDDGGWVPIHKAAARYLPRAREFSEVEAMVSLAIDLDEGRRLTVRQYSRIWRWSRGKVARFLGRVGAPNASKSAGHGRATDETSDGPADFKYVAGLRHGAGHGRATDETSDGPQLKILSRSGSQKTKRREPKPWHGKTRDLEALLGCAAYVKHLAEISPVLSTWSAAEIRHWARRMVDKARENRRRRRAPPLVAYAQLLERCAISAQGYEREQAPEELSGADLQPVLLGPGEMRV